MQKFYPYLLLFFFIGNFFTIPNRGFSQNIDTIQQMPSSKIRWQIDSVVYSAIQAAAFPGCVIYASHLDSVLFFKSYGFHAYDSLIPTKKDNLFDLASITKIAGGTLALMKLYQDGLIQLDDPIRNYIKIGGKIGKVTIREALAHQGGITPWIPYHQAIRKRNGTFRKKDIRSQEEKGFTFKMAEGLYLSDEFYEKRIKKLIRKSAITKNPTYRYSGLFFYLIPELVQQLSGMTFEQYLNTFFYQPLGAETMGFNPMHRFDPDRIVPTEIDTFFRHEPIHGLVHDEGAIMMRGISGNAGLFSTAEDLSKIMKMLLDQGKKDTIQFLLPQTIDLFTTTQYPNLENRRGLGFDKPLIFYDADLSSVAQQASPQSYGHTGYTGTLVWVDPESNLIFIFLSNRVFPTRNNKALYELNVRPTIHQFLYDLIHTTKEGG